MFYVGADYGRVTVSNSNLQGFPVTNGSAYLIDGRLGTRVTQYIGLEGHYGKSINDRAGETHLGSYYGVYLVPTGTLLGAVEVSFKIGFAWAKIENNNLSKTQDGISYGGDMEFPLRYISESMPNLLFGGGAMVYQQNNSARTYGWHAGVRFDFEI